MANQRRVRWSDHNGLNRSNRHFCVFFYFATNDDRFLGLGWSVFQAHMQLCNDEEKGVNLQVAGFDTIFQRWTGFFFLFYLLSFASLAFSVEELESLIVIIIIRVSCANWLDDYMWYMAKTEEFEEKRSTSCEEVEKV